MIRSARLRPCSTSPINLRRYSSLLNTPTSQYTQRLARLPAVGQTSIKRNLTHSCLCTRTTNRSIALSANMSRRVASTKSDGKHDHGTGHGHKHSDEGCDHNHGGIFHTHVHDHSEGAQQLITALSAGKLDRGTRITLLGEH